MDGTQPNLTPLQERALDAAEAALAKSYVPYSHFSVGACLVTLDDELIAGSNFENAAFGPTICAERSAVAVANAAGRRSFKGVAVIGRGQELEPEAAAVVTGPCGICRQVLYEFADIGSNDPWVVLSSPSRENIVVTSVRGLLPYGFGPANLGIDVTEWR